MSKKAIRSIITLMSISLIGIVAFQVYWIKNSIELERNKLNKEIQKTLSKVSEKVIKEEAKLLIKNNIAENKTKNKKQPKEKIQIVVQNNQYNYQGPKGKTIVINSNDGETTIIKTSETTITTSTSSTIDGAKQEFQSKKELLIDVVDELAYEYAITDLNLAKRLENINLDSLLSDQFNYSGMENLTFDYSVYDLKNDSLIIQKNGKLNEVKTNNFITNLTTDGELRIELKDEMYPILNSLKGTLLLSILLTLILVGTFIYTINSIVKQKRVSTMKADFINNMTHEFKTPIATISLAIDSILHQDIIEKPNEIKKLGVIVKKENTRMNEQIESLLSIAQFDQEDLELNFESINVHELILEIKDSFEMKTKALSGNISLNLKADKVILYMDKMHLYNCIRNVIDNGIKYSPSNFRIRIKTNLENGKFIISISDRGIGMNKETQRKIFDRFYRKSEGNIHTTKGFGLGLAYTKEILTKMNSEISVESEVDKGSTFFIKIPLNQ